MPKLNPFSISERARLGLGRRWDPAGFDELSRVHQEREKVRFSRPEMWFIEPASMCIWLIGRAALMLGCALVMWIAMGIYSQHPSAANLPAFAEAFAGYAHAVGPDGLRTDFGNCAAIVVFVVGILVMVAPRFVFSWATPVDQVVQKRLLASAGTGVMA